MIVSDASWIGPWVCERGGGSWQEGRGCALGLTDSNDGLIAGVLYEDWNGAQIICHIAGVGNWSSCRAYMRAIFAYPFRQLKAKRITAPVASCNLKAQRFVERLGFVRESTLTDAHPDGDIFIYKMTPDKCRWLKL